MTFEYTLLDLGGLDHRKIAAALNKLGADGWELVAVHSPQTAILKRATQPTTQAEVREVSQSVPPKYRDPATGETWSGRGRMASWLAERVKAGRRREDFLV